MRLIQVKARLAGLGESGFMPSPFTAFALGPQDIAVVFPLVHAVAADIDLPRWRRFAERMLAPPGGALGLRGAAGYVCGLLLYRVEHDLRHGMVLAVDLFTALDLVNEERAAHALMHAAEAKARELGCAATHIRTAAAQPALAALLAAAGHAPEAAVFCKALGPMPRAS